MKSISKSKTPVAIAFAFAFALIGLFLSVTSCGPVAGDAPLFDGPLRYDPSYLMEVEVELSDDNFDAMRFQARRIDEVFGPTCHDGPASKPYTYFPGAVIVDGEELVGVGVRAKGYVGSVNAARPSMKIKTHEYDDALAFDDDTKRLTLNNANQDASRIRSCLAYLAFSKAGVPSPSCNFAHVIQQGEDMGIFVNVEPIRGDFLLRNFNDDTGGLLEGAITDFHVDYLQSFQIKQTPDEAELRDAMLELERVLRLSDDELLEALEEVVDLDLFYRFWITENLVDHWDGYAGNRNNFWVYRRPVDGKFVFIPWGPDAAFGVKTRLGAGTDRIAVAKSNLTWRLFRHEEGRKRYYDLLGDVAAALDFSALASEAQRMHELLVPFVREEWLGEFNTEHNDIVAFLNERQQRVDEEQASAPAFDAPLEGLIDCMTSTGSIHLEFSQPYEPLGPELPFYGEGTFELNVGGETYSGNLKGWSGEGDSPSSRFYLSNSWFLSADGLKDLIVILKVLPELVEVGEPVDIDEVVNFGAIIDISDTENTEFVGVFSPGEVTLSTFEPVPGGTVAGVVDATLLLPDDVDILKPPPEGCGCSSSEEALATSLWCSLLILVLLALPFCRRETRRKRDVTSRKLRLTDY
ncbi:MAG: hypothetical protein GY822_12390 [Deltaproteobacteria bacterium]|nr:hypothetical protein [Deltaproteobacteria bacterium]